MASAESPPQSLCSPVERYLQDALKVLYFDKGGYPVTRIRTLGFAKHDETRRNLTRITELACLLN